jgi:hypothetical protein
MMTRKKLCFIILKEKNDSFSFFKWTNIMLVVLYSMETTQKVLGVEHE